MRYRFALLLALLATGRLWAAEPANVLLYECRAARTPPVLDGKLTDPCWQDLPLMAGFFQYWSPVPKPPALRTVGRLCYDAAGLYLGITLYDDKIEAMRTAITGRDNPDTWQDDCVEVMVDPLCCGTGYRKFTTNFNEARLDEKMTSMVGDAGWNAEGWRVRTSRDAGAWYIELMVPWSDLDSTPHEGDLWAFDLVRYGYSSGGFKGVTWSLGGSYAAPHNFGFLHFGPVRPGDPHQLQQLAQVVSRTRGRDFRVFLPGQVLTHSATGWHSEPLTGWLARELRQAQTALAAAAEGLEGVPPGAERTRLTQQLDAARGDVTALQERLQATAEPNASSALLLRADCQAAATKLAELRWEGLLWALLARS